MTATEEVRYHEGGHVVAAVALDVGLKKVALTLTSDQEACTHIAQPNEQAQDEAWYVRRAAVKLAGPVAMIRLRGQEMCEETLIEESEYLGDYNEARQVLQKYWLERGYGAAEHVVQSQMDRAAKLAVACIDGNKCAIQALRNATSGKDTFSREQVLEVLAEHQPLFVPSDI